MQHLTADLSHLHEESGKRFANILAYLGFLGFSWFSFGL